MIRSFEKPKNPEKTAKIRENVEDIKLTGNLDTDKIITEKLSEGDFINLYRAMPNLKIFQNDTFWQNRFQRRHTKHQKVLRPKNKTWKELSLHLGYFNWCPSDWFSILGMSDCLKKQLLLAVEDFFQENARIWQQGLMASIRKKDIDLIEFFIWKGARCWNDAMNASAAVGDQVLVRFFIDHGANDFIEAAEVARKHGHLELAKEILAIKYTEYHI